MTSEDSPCHRRRHHLPTGNPDVFCSNPYHQRTPQQSPFHIHADQPRHHGDQSKDETDSRLLKQIGQQLAGIGDEVNSRYSNNNVNNNINNNNNNNNGINNSSDDPHFSIRFSLTLHLLPYFSVALEMITRRRPPNNNIINNNNNNNNNTNDTDGNSDVIGGSLQR